MRKNFSLNSNPAIVSCIRKNNINLLVFIQVTTKTVCFCHHFCKNQAKMPPKTLYIYFLQRILSVAKN